MSRRYAIIGSGALGGLYGAMLARNGFEVHFLLHSDYHYVREHGWRIESPWGDFTLTDVHAHRSAESIPPCDVTLIGLKTTNNHLLAEMLPAPTAGGGVVLVLQNGLDVEAEAAAVVGENRVLGGCCFLCSNKMGPGHVRHLDYGRIVFGDYRRQADGVSATARQIESDLNAAGIECQATDDLQRARWQKLMWNIPFNGLSVVLDATTKDLVDHSDALQLCEAVVSEVHGAAAICGIQIPTEAIARTIENTRKMVPYDSSMRVDHIHRRPMEVEAIFGNPLRAAAACNAQTPLVEMLYRQLKFIDARNLASPQ